MPPQPDLAPSLRAGRAQKPGPPQPRRSRQHGLTAGARCPPPLSGLPALRGAGPRGAGRAGRRRGFFRAERRSAKPGSGKRRSERSEQAAKPVGGGGGGAGVRPGPGCGRGGGRDVGAAAAGPNKAGRGGGPGCGSPGPRGRPRLSRSKSAEGSRKGAASRPGRASLRAPVPRLPAGLPQARRSVGRGRMRVSPGLARGPGRRERPRCQPSARRFPCPGAEPRPQVLALQTFMVASLCPFSLSLWRSC